MHASFLVGNDSLPEAPKYIPLLEGGERVGADFAAGRHAMKEHLYYEAFVPFSSALKRAPNLAWKAPARGAPGDAHLALADWEGPGGRRKVERSHAVKASELYRLLRQSDSESLSAKPALWKMGQAMMTLQMFIEGEGWLEHALNEVPSELYRRPVQLARA